MREKEKKVIEDLFLIKNIIKYIVADDSENLNKKHEELSRLEEKVLNDKKSNKKKSHNSEFLEEVLFELNKNKSKDDFSIDIKKEKRENKFSLSQAELEKREIEEAQSFVIKYQENEREERLQVEAEDQNKQRYSFEIVKEKEVSEKRPYQLQITYESGKKEDKLEIKYNLRDYPSERENALQDFTNQLDKTLHIMPKSLMGGVLGYTYLGENFMARREDLNGSKALMVDVHEAIHTDNEYETRVLTSWILTRERVKYKR